MKKLGNFFKEVWRRNVIQMAIPYGIGSWLLIQIADTILPIWDTPQWVFKAIIYTLAAGFPIAIILAWIFDFSPKGLVRTADIDAHPADYATPEEEIEPEPAPALSLDFGGSDRRRVAMLNCVLHVDSEDDEELDPEDLTDLLTSIEIIYQGITEQYEGYRLPDQPEELSLVFGYPEAHDDDARRAVAAGLATLSKIKTMSLPAFDDEVSVSAHAAVHSGLVVVDDSLSDSEGTSIIGRVPRVTSFLQTIAPANTLVVSQQTNRLISNHFKSEELGTHQPAQLGGKLTVYGVERELEPGEAGAKEKNRDRRLVGRDHELRLLEERWDDVVDGEGQFALIKGEPGIGKSTVVRAFVDYVKQTDDFWLLPWHCSPYEQNSPFYPMLQFLRGPWFGFDEQDSNAEKLAKIELGLAQHTVDPNEAVPLFANLLSVELPDDSPFDTTGATAQVLRQRSMGLLLNMFRDAARKKPVLLLVDGMHWIDPSTLEILEMILDHGSSPGLFLLMTSRPELPADWHSRSNIMEIDLHHLSRRVSREMVEEIAGDTKLPDEMLQRIVDETDGNPMFIEELTLAVLESDTLRNSHDLSGAELAKLHIPATLQESLAARVDKLGSAKSLLQVCSMLGRDFRYSLLLAVSDTPNETALLEELSQIVKSELLFRRGSEAEIAYTFKHFLIQETAYQSLLKSTRKSLHVRIGEILESQFPDTARLRPQQLAGHFSSGGKIEKAVEYWVQASRRSVLRSANLEAIEQARSGLALLKKIPESKTRNELEAPLQSALGSALLASQGYTAPEVREAFTRARELSEKIDNTEQLFQIVVGLWMYYQVGAQYDEALDTGTQLLRIAKAGGNAGQQVQAHYSIAYTHFYRGEFNDARDQYELALSAEVEGSDHSSQSASVDDTRTHVRCMMAHACWHLGLPETASRYADEANELAHNINQPYAITFISFFNAWFHQLRGEPGPASIYANECVQLAEENGYRFFIPLGRFVQAWAESRPHETGSQAEDTSAAVKMKESMDMCLQAGVGSGVTYLMFQLAEEYLEHGLYEEALEQLENGQQHNQKTGENYLEPEYYRLNGRLCLDRFSAENDDTDLEKAIDFLTKALSHAKLNHSKGLQLRAATDLAEALQQKGETTRAVDTLDAVINSFEEFDDSGDCVRALEVLNNMR